MSATLWRGKSYTVNGWKDVELWHVAPCAAHAFAKGGCLRLGGICYPVYEPMEVPCHGGGLRAIERVEMAREDEHGQPSR